MVYTATNINNSATIVAQTGTTVTTPVDVRGKAVKYDSSGNVVLASTVGEIIVGIAILTNDETVKAGDDVHIQVKDIGVALAGSAIAVGDELTADADGKVKKATDGDFVIATALESAGADGKYIRVQITKYVKPSKA